MKRQLALVLGAALVFTACGDDDENNDNNATAQQEIVLDFEGTVGSDVFSCGGGYQLGMMGTASQISDFKMYISEIALLDADGNEVPLALTADGKWQTERVALLDFEDATGACANGTTEMNRQVKGMAPEGEYTGVAFTLGVPFEDNHQDVATAGAPLNLASMFWNWQGGYKFLRLDGMAGPEDGMGGFRVHLGSTACEMADGSMDVSKCNNPNRVRVQLQDFDHTQDRIRANAMTLFSEVDMTPNMEGNSAICMSSPDHMVCNQVFPKLGLKFGMSDAQDQAFIDKM